MKTGQILEKFREKGFRMTKIRTKLLELFANAFRPLSVQELLDNLEKENITANKTTIYRELYFLMEQEVITEIDFGDRRKRYESAHAGHHHHLVCLKCLTVKDVTLSSELKKEERRMERQNNFTITSHSLEFFGLCGRCKT